MSGASEAGGVPEGLGILGPGLVVQQLCGIHVLVLAPDVLVHHQRRQTRPHHGAAEGAQLDDVAEGLGVGLESRESPQAEGAHVSVRVGSFLLLVLNDPYKPSFVLSFEGTPGFVPPFPTEHLQVVHSLLIQLLSEWWVGSSRGLVASHSKSKPPIQTS